ncbi:hypothetical protein AAGG74_15895 [Bacillus mexicanus]|uniref:hypothetical protein n=1 Tax=Bacillus mexicanus TaxID=2834415 RepID=UPI003D1AA2B0
MFQEQKNEKSRFDSNTFVRAAFAGIEELKKMIEFIEQLQENPRLLISSFSDQIKEDIKFIYSPVLKRYAEDKEKLKGDEFPKFLAEKINQGFKEILNDEGIKENFELKLSSYSTFPTKYQIICNGKDIGRVNIYDKLFGGFPKSRKKYLQEELKRIGEYITQINKQIEMCEEILKKPYTKIKTPLDIFILIFKRKKLTLALNEKLKYLNENLAIEEKRRLGLKKELDEVDVYDSKLLNFVSIIETVFKKFGYCYTDETSRLY